MLTGLKHFLVKHFGTMPILFNKYSSRTVFHVLVILLLSGCSGANADVIKNEYPPIFPDYTEITVPAILAPLRFRVTVPGEKHRVVFRAGQEQRVVKGSKEVRIPRRDWRKLMQTGAPAVEVHVAVKQAGSWIAYKPFHIYLSGVPIDRYLTYRRISPGYSVYGAMGIYQRDLYTYKEWPVIENSFSEGSCVNCHSYAAGDPENMMFHIRGKQGGTVIIADGVTGFVDLKTPQSLSAGVYPCWHPSGDYIAYSVNITRQLFHSRPDKVLDVYDLASDLVIYDVKKECLIVPPQLQDSTLFETFPAFSADGKTLYFCGAVSGGEGSDPLEIRYSLYKTTFNPDDGSVGDVITKVLEMDGKSIAFPRPSPDGKYLMFTLASYGTFPIWHPEADLFMMDLESGQVRNTEALNSSDTDSYHSWSSNSRWIVFSSRRTDGLHTRPYIALLKEDGTFTKPFLLPQSSVGYYDDLLQSFNIPEFSKGPVHFSPRELEKHSRPVSY
jgi:hypothetical protein